jgi:ABC-type uncharacterized transport system involved in gliding motility auxiliary subunit
MMIRGILEKTGGWLILSLAAIIAFLLINLAIGNVAGMRADLTEDRVYTLSPGTENILTTLDKPITLTLYYSASLGTASPIYGNYATRVKDMLRVFASASGGNLTVTIKDPKPYSEIEDKAVELGLQGIPLDQTGAKAYFGLAAASGKANDAIPFLQIERENFLEYDLASVINKLGSDRKTVLAVQSSRPIFGDFRLQMRGLPMTPTALVEQLRGAFDVKQIFSFEDIWEIKPDVLMIVHPGELDDQEYYHLDQYLLRGGKALIFVDPFNETAAGRQRGPMPERIKSDIKKLLDHWGIEIADDKIAGDMQFAQLVNAGSDQQVVPARFLSWMKMQKEAFSAKDAVTSDINVMHIQSAGIINTKPDAPVTVEPLIVTSTQSQAIDIKLLSGPRPEILKMQEQFKPSGKPFTVAARLRGRVKSLFPDGPPKEKVEADEKADTKSESGKAKDAPKPEVKADKAERPQPASDGAKPPAKQASDPVSEAPAGPAPASGGEEKTADSKKEKPKAPPHIAESTRPMNVILVADADLLEDRFWVRKQDFFGQQVQVPFANNAAFVVNAVENLAGGDDLISLRSRGTARRPFTKIAELRLAADTRFRNEEQQLRNKLTEAEKRLAELSKKKADGTSEAAVTKAVETTATEITQEILTTRKQLRNVQLALREDIESLESGIRFANIALIPILVGLVAILLGGLRLRRRTQAVHTGDA